MGERRRTRTGADESLTAPDELAYFHDTEVQQAVVTLSKLGQALQHLQPMIRESGTLQGHVSRLRNEHVTIQAKIAEDQDTLATTARQLGATSAELATARALAEQNAQQAAQEAYSVKEAELTATHETEMTRLRGLRQAQETRIKNLDAQVDEKEAVVSRLEGVVTQLQGTRDTLLSDIRQG